MLYKIILNVLQILNIKYFQHRSQIIYILYIIKSDIWRLVAFDKFTNLCSFHLNQNIEHRYHPSTLRKQLILWG